VVIDEVKELDFGSYKFEVQNAHDIGEIKIKLIEGMVFPSRPEPENTVVIVMISQFEDVAMM
jgi:hypothetical protein